MYKREARIPDDLVYGPPPDLSHAEDVPEFVAQRRDALQAAFETTRRHLGSAATRRKRQYDLRTRPQEFPVDSWVWVYVPRRKQGRYQKWRGPYQGPLLVTKRLGPVNYVVQRTPKTRPWIVHVDKLKPCIGPERGSWLESPTGSNQLPENSIENPPLEPRPGVSFGPRPDFGTIRQLVFPRCTYVVNKRYTLLFFSVIMFIYVVVSQTSWGDNRDGAASAESW